MNQVINYETRKGDSVGRVAQVAVAMAKEKDAIVKFSFNDIPLVAKPHFSAEQICEVYVLKMELLRQENESISRSGKLEEILTALKS